MFWEMVNNAMEVGDGKIKTFALRGVRTTLPTCMTSDYRRWTTPLNSSTWCAVPVP
jgi:hypothetical protein